MYMQIPVRMINLWVVHSSCQTVELSKGVRLWLWMETITQITQIYRSLAHVRLGVLGSSERVTSSPDVARGTANSKVTVWIPTEGGLPCTASGNAALPV